MALRQGIPIFTPEKYYRFSKVYGDERAELKGYGYFVTLLRKLVRSRFVCDNHYYFKKIVKSLGG